MDTTETKYNIVVLSGSDSEHLFLFKLFVYKAISFGVVNVQNASGLVTFRKVPDRLSTLVMLSSLLFFVFLLQCISGDQL